MENCGTSMISAWDGFLLIMSIPISLVLLFAGIALVNKYIIKDSL